ncbi:MAG: cupredoxin domain-containing protein [Candidatus Dormibacteria bacterium]
MKLPKIRVAAAPVLLMLAGCGSSGTATGSPADPGTVQLTMDTQDIRFNPGVITAKPGEKIALTVSNRDSVKHNFTITELGVNQDLDPGKTLTFVFTTKGSTDLQFFCQYHKARGMVGTLNLSGNAPATAPSAAPSSAAPAASRSPYSTY